MPIPRSDYEALRSEGLRINFDLLNVRPMRGTLVFLSFAFRPPSKCGRRVSIPRPRS